MAMRRSSRARMPSRPRGASSTPFSTTGRPCIATAAGRGGHPRPMRSSPTATAGTTRGRRSERAAGDRLATMTIPPCFLVGDVGATNTRLAITTMRNGTVEWVHEVRVADAEIPSFDAALDTLFAASPVERTRIAAACLGVAGPILDHHARFTHRDWTIDANAITATLGGAPAKLVNDLQAAAAGIDGLQERDLVVLQPRTAVRGGARLVIGAGTGLGVAYAVWCGNGYKAVASEGGHAGFAPQNARQMRLLEALRAGGKR